MHLSRHKERGPERITYTLKDVAEVFGVGKRTLRRWQCDDDDPFDPRSLQSICEKYHCRRNSERLKAGNEGREPSEGADKEREIVLVFLPPEDDAQLSIMGLQFEA